MTDKKISELAALTGADMQATDQVVVARASTSQNFSMTRQEFLNSSDALLESSLESPSAVRTLANRSFATRAAAVTEWTAMVARSETPPVGTVWTADGLSYRYAGSGTDISDLAGWVPDGVMQSGHFPNVAAAEAYIAAADTTGWEEQEVGKGFIRLPGRENVRRLEDKFGDVIDVRDFSGIDPTGASSSLSAIQAAVTEWRLLTSGGNPNRGMLYFPPTSMSGGEYVIDGSVNLTSLRGHMNNIMAYGAVFRGVGAGNVIFDTSNSLQINFQGGQIIGDDTDVPAVGLQLARILSGGTNPSSHHHFVQNTTIDGYWTTACLYNYASEENYYRGLQLRNQSPGMDRYCLVMDGQSGEFTPTSDHQTMGFGAYTGFAQNLFHKCAFWRTAVDGSGISGPAIFMSRVQNHQYVNCLTQVRKAPTVVLHHVSGERGTKVLRLDFRAETESAESLIYFTGDDGAVHRNVEVKLDRLFCQKVFEPDTALTDGQLILADLRVEIANVFPGAASSNPAGNAMLFGTAAERAKFDLVSGDIQISNKTTDEAGFVNLEVDCPDFRGRLKLSDRTQIQGSLPTGNYRLEDDVDFPTEVTTDDTTTYSFAIQDSQATPNVSATSVNAKVWRRGDRMYMAARGLSSIDITGLTSTDIARIPLPRAIASEFSTGQAILGNLSSPPTGGTGTIDQIQVSATLSGNTVSFKLIDASGTQPNLTVSHFNGASIHEFYFEWDV